ncbi:VOC family protein [Deinococcus sp. PEB2-63]
MTVAGIWARLDHLVVAARSLPEGREWLEGRLRVPLQPGGEHELFGTHNLLLSLGPDAYLEVIAVNPDAPPPARARWFALDTPDMQEQLAHGPALVHWVAQVPRVPAGPDALPLSRGENRWVLTVPPDGSLPGGGAAPSLIHWLTPPPPTRLPDVGVRLAGLRLGSPEPDGLRAALDALSFHGEVEVVEVPQVELRATLDTPHGPVEL